MARAVADDGIPRSRTASRSIGGGALDDDDERDEWEEDGLRSGASHGFVPLAGRSALGGDDGLDGLLDFEDGVEEEELVEEEVRCGRALDEFESKQCRRIAGLQGGWRVG
jgi:hypothetical protein